MRAHGQASSPVLLTTFVSIAVAWAVAQAAPAQPPTTLEAFQWLDVSGDPLPFQDDAAVCEALRSATLVSREQLSRPGLGGFEMLVLEHGGTQFYALFRSRDDAAKLEVAASQVDQLLGLHLVPPVVERSIGDDTGAVQIWRQRAGTELEIAQVDQLVPPDTRDFAQQRQTMYLFDNLIANPGRSQENTLIDPAWRIWLIDHASAFQQKTDLLYQLELTKCDRTLWQRLQELDNHTLEELVTPYLDKKQTSTLLARHRKLVRHIQQMITTYGEDVVLFDGAP